MDFGKCSLVALVVMAGLGLGQAFEVVSKDQELMVAIGSNVTLECIVEGDDFEYINNPIVFLKGEDKHSINNNRLINEPFKKTNRYTMDIGGVGYRENILTMEGVTAAENDVFHCKVGSDIMVTYNIIIPEPIEEISMTSDNSDVDQESGKKTFSFEVDKQYFVHCEVKGGRPEPVVKVYRDGTEDITASFSIDKVPVSDSSEGEGLEVMRYQVFLKNDNFKISTEFNNQNLSCKANVPVNKTRAKELGLSGLKKTDSAKMEITYAPQIDCESEKETMEGTKQFRIECVVKANPKINMGEIIWSFPEGENGTTEIKHVKNQKWVDGQYETMAEEDDAEVIVIFEIKNVNSSDFKVYTLQVENDVGREQHEVHVFRKTTTLSTTTQMSVKAEPDTGSVHGESRARNTVATIFSLVLSILLVIIL